MSPARILIIDDEPSIVENITYALQTDGFEYDVAPTLRTARELLLSHSYQLIVLDIGLPDGNGFDFCRELRKELDTPIIFLTARSEEIDRVVGLEIGGDDYVVKPFSPRELIARIKVILRRIQAPASPASAEKSTAPDYHGFSIDDYHCHICFQQQALELSLYEYRLMKTFLGQPGRVFTRDILMHQAWDDPHASCDRTIDSHIKNLRQKIKTQTGSSEWIKTHRGLGYSFQVPTN